MSSPLNPLPCPTWDGFLQFLTNVVQIPPSQLPVDNPSTPAAIAYWVALEIVNETLACIGGTAYTLAVYNLATDRLINFMPDTGGQTFWFDLRKKYEINSVSLGVVSSTSDESTSMSQLNPEQMKMFTMADLQMLKTPYGRQYLGYAQSYGTLWGLS